MQNFTDKVAAITGAGSGMGRALALSLAKQGCHVAISDIDVDALIETESLIKSGVKVTRHTIDVSNRLDVKNYASAVEQQHGKVNMVFNNAGVTVVDTVEHMSLEDFEWLMSINFWGVVYGTRAFLPFLREQSEAHIINTSSIFGVVAVPTQSAYNASKFAVRGFTYSLRQELADSHIGVSCVQPGGVKTNIVENSRFVPSDNASATKEEFAQQFQSFAGLTSEQAADQILAGVKKNKAQILVGKDAKILALLERIMPTSHQKLLGLLDRG
ncbi:MAG: NADP-dependent 3-hydroxy acid dehydrogenase YdfG [Candidatus Azotimanducaceae bacterium]|jgi:NADP-dependent 3-hydroxy acid dehydrogenase YdfG